MYKHPHVREWDRYEYSYEKDRDPVTYPYTDRVQVVYPVVEPVNPAVEPPAVAKTKEVGAIGVARPSPLLYSPGAYPGADPTGSDLTAVPRLALLRVVPYPLVDPPAAPYIVSDPTTAVDYVDYAVYYAPLIGSLDPVDEAKAPPSPEAS